MVNGRTIITDDGRSRLENKRIYGNGTYLVHNWGLYSNERREGKHLNREPCRYMRDHAVDLKDDPERLSTDFMLGLVWSLRKVGE